MSCRGASGPIRKATAPTPPVGRAGPCGRRARQRVGNTETDGFGIYTTDLLSRLLLNYIQLTGS